MKVSFGVIEESSKAYLIDEVNGEGFYGTRFLWVPKSICKVSEYVATVNALGEPEKMGVRICEIADWFCFKNRIK